MTGTHLDKQDEDPNHKDLKEESSPQIKRKTFENLTRTILSAKSLSTHRTET